MMRTVAKSHIGAALFIHIDSDKEAHARIMEFFGLKTEDLPAIRLINLGEDMQKFSPSSKELTVEVVSGFVSDFFSNKLKQSLKSQDLPADWNENPVKILVAENFNAVVMDPTKNVLVEFYAPWCGHCKQLSPIWDQLGEAFEDEASVVIAKMDSTLNEIEGLKVTGFPTLKFYPAGATKVPLEYEGDRTLVGFTAYLKKAVHGVEEVQEVDTHDEL